METAYYPTVRDEAGVALDSRVDWAKTDWMHFAAAYATDDMTRDMFINDVHAFISEASADNQVPFSDKYFVTGDMGDPVGGYDAYRARPVVGGHFAVLALDGAGSITGAKRATGTKKEEVGHEELRRRWRGR